ncbi:YcgN family cysteine cluster protein [Agarilytica rhodophyticola]|uniref:YcgN family cysteine cluster protein n=1 Tax=Agarilytica rhodophyticola TaxID=1737490 RepID=UPI000B345886|nr:YcgN family cysteine cluster protein [Agarilytica rhodophyticola]
MSDVQPFWQTKELSEMTREEWESLCDGCGQCCLHKLEDEDSGEIFYTDVVCRYSNNDTCHCERYSERSVLVPTCVTLTPENLYDYDWLPLTCAYRLLSQGKPLYNWHPLVSGNPESVHEASMSIRYRAISEDNINEDDLEERIVHWVL